MSSYELYEWGAADSEADDDLHRGVRPAARRSVQRAGDGGTQEPESPSTVPELSDALDTDRQTDDVTPTLGPYEARYDTSAGYDTDPDIIVR